MKYVYKSTSWLCGLGTFTSNFLLRPLSFISVSFRIALYYTPGELEVIHGEALETLRFQISSVCEGTQGLSNG